MRLLKWGWTLASIAACGFIAYRTFTYGSLIEQVAVIIVTVGAILAAIIVTGISALGRDAEIRHEETLAALRPDRSTREHVD